MSIDRGVDQEDVVHIRSGILATKTNEILSFVAIWMDLENTMLSEISQTKMNTILHHLSAEYKIIQMNVYGKQKQTQRETDSEKQTQKTNVVIKGKWKKERQIRGVDLQIPTTVYKLDKQQGYII